MQRLAESLGREDSGQQNNRMHQSAVFDVG